MNAEQPVIFVSFMNKVKFETLVIFLLRFETRGLAASENRGSFNIVSVQPVIFCVEYNFKIKLLSIFQTNYFLRLFSNIEFFLIRFSVFLIFHLVIRQERVCA